MNTNEAIQKIKRVKGLYAYESDYEALDMAIAALEKQEAAKIVVGKSRGGVTLWNECSKCGEPVDAKDIFCRRCGRKLISLPEPYTEDEDGEQKSGN